MNTYKVLVLGEMIALMAGTLVNQHEAKQDSWTPTFLSKPVLQKAIAVTSLMALLMFLVEIGLGGLAATFGLLIVAGYLTQYGEKLGASIIALQQRIYS